MANKNIPAKPRKTAHFQMGDVVQHVHQHTPDPRDLDYRAQAFSFALQASAGLGGGFRIADLIADAGRIESYLRGDGGKDVQA